MPCNLRTKATNKSKFDANCLKDICKWQCNFGSKSPVNRLRYRNLRCIHSSNKKTCRNTRHSFHHICRCRPRALTRNASALLVKFSGMHAINQAVNQTSESKQRDHVQPSNLCASGGISYHDSNKHMTQ